MNPGKSRFIGILFLTLTICGSLNAVVNFHFCHGELVSVGILRDAKKCWGFYEALEIAAQEQHDEHIRSSCCDESQVIIESVVECESSTDFDETFIPESIHSLIFISRKKLSSSTCHHYKNPLHHKYRHVLFENYRC